MGERVRIQDSMSYQIDIVDSASPAISHAQRGFRVRISVDRQNVADVRKVTEALTMALMHGTAKGKFLAFERVTRDDIYSQARGFSDQHRKEYEMDVLRRRQES